ncbi:MAG: hypothetical protein IPK90_11460 [Chitinophagaceae bacterium]|nr:hypothetical protein [Chitinophagaceae bacterium]
MKKLIALTAICSVICMAVFFPACNNNKSEPKVADQNDSLKKVVERGDYLANHVAACIHCHSKRDFTKYSGPVVPEQKAAAVNYLIIKFLLPFRVLCMGKNYSG